MEEQITIEEVNRALRAAKGSAEGADFEQMMREMPEVPAPSDDEMDAMERALGLPSRHRDAGDFSIDVLMAVGL